MIYTKEEIAKLVRPCVYVFRADERYLYIGSTGHGFIRIFERSHKQAMRCLSECTHLEIIECNDVDQARQMEYQLVAKHKPAYNSQNRHYVKPDREHKRKRVTFLHVLP